MTIFSYKTIQNASEGLYREKGSKFLAFAYPVVSEDEIREKIDQLKKEYFDARHHCFAWMLGADKKSFRSFDDGEPNHSAGDPILGQIRSKNLTNILVVVVRYFGGVKLGVGGLIAAYKAAAEDALDNAIIIEKEIRNKFAIGYAYISTPEVMRLIKEFELVITHQEFTADCRLEVEVPLRVKDRLIEKINLLNALGTHLEAQELR